MFMIDASNTTTNCATASNARASQRRGSAAAALDEMDDDCEVAGEAVTGCLSLVYIARVIAYNFKTR
jgi:hypothetical protein